MWKYQPYNYGYENYEICTPPTAELELIQKSYPKDSSLPVKCDICQYNCIITTLIRAFYLRNLS